MDIIERKPADLLNRENIVARVEFEGATPSRAQLKNQLATKLKTKEELIVVNKVNTAFGKSLAVVKAHVYKNEADMKKMEGKPALKRNAKKEEKKEEKPAEAAPAAPPAEEKKEEAPAPAEKPAEEPKPEEKKE
jgi:small subunit ribosomal protein S24e